MRLALIHYATRIQAAWRGFASRREEHLSLEAILNFSLFGAPDLDYDPRVTLYALQCPS